MGTFIASWVLNTYEKREEQGGHGEQKAGRTGILEKT